MSTTSVDNLKVVWWPVCSSGSRAMAALPLSLGAVPLNDGHLSEPI